jgi:hypothetical protein
VTYATSNATKVQVTGPNSNTPGSAQSGDQTLQLQYACADPTETFTLTATGGTGTQPATQAIKVTPKLATPQSGQQAPPSTNQ